MEVKKIYIKPESCVVFNEDLCDAEIVITNSKEAHHGNAKQQTFDEYDFDELDEPMWDDYDN
jgi:hypothetical protein